MNIFFSLIEKTFVSNILFIIVVFFFCFLSSIFLLQYSAWLYRKIKQTEPEFFEEKPYPMYYYLVKTNHTQFIFYLVFNQYKKIKNQNIRRKCNKARNFAYLVYACFFILIIGNLLGNLLLHFFNV